MFIEKGRANIILNGIMEWNDSSHFQYYSVSGQRDKEKIKS